MKKSNFDRRDLLKGLLAVQGAAAMTGLLSSCNKGAENQQPKAASDLQSASLSKGGPTSTINFNIVLHGTYVLQFDTQNKQALILIPTVLKDDGTEAHEYKAGTFQREQKTLALPGATLVFDFPLDQANPLPDAVMKVPAYSDPTQFVIVRKSDLKQRPGGGPLRNKFQLPYPHSLQVAAAQKFHAPGQTFFDNDGLIPKKPVQVPLCLLLQYRLDTLCTLPVIGGLANLPHINYHIYAEAHEPHGGKHVKTAFSQLTSLYDDVGGLKLTDKVLQDIDQGQLMDDAKPKVPDDLVTPETLSLEDRDGKRIPTGASHVGSCAGVILVSGPDA